MKKIKIITTLLCATALTFNAVSQVKVEQAGNMSITTDYSESLRLNRSNSGYQYIGFYQSNSRKAWLGVDSDNSFRIWKQNGGNMEFGGASYYLFQGEHWGLVSQVTGDWDKAFQAWNGYNSSKFTVYGNGNIYSRGIYIGSDKRYKKNIKEITCHNKLKMLNAMKYEYIGESTEGKSLKSGSASKVPQKQGTNTFGFIAQDVIDVFPEVVLEDEKGYLSINYIAFIPLLVEAYKEQQVQLDNQAKDIEDLQKALEKLSKNNGSQKSAQLNSDDNNLIATEAILYQNTPNPFSENTTIKFFLPESINSANLYIYNMNGEPIKTIDISERGEGNIQISGTELSAGMYLYALIADGKEIDTKRMILTE